MQPRQVHFIGICGTAMASVAVALKERGFAVTGSDKDVYPPMSDFLEANGVKVMSGYAEAHLSGNPDLVVVGNAISRGNMEAEAVLDRKLRYCSLPELLKEHFLWGKRCLVVAGTHGKTTTTSLLAWVFEHNGYNPGYFIGGIPKNLGRGARFTDSEWFILEGDEYDTAFFDKRAKFVHYLPEVAIINNIEFDHADIFEDLRAVQTSFERLIRLVPRNGLLLANGDDPNIESLLRNAPCPVRRFGLGPGNTHRATDCELTPEQSTFFAPRLGPGGDDVQFSLPLVGEFNVRNALAVAVCAWHCGLRVEEIQRAFSTFESIRRRMEVKGCERGVTVVDDFAHHPTAIRETLRALRIKYPGRRIWAVFEPRTNTTRRNVLQAELLEALERADLVVVAEVARLELLDISQRLDPEKLIADLRRAGRPAVYLPTVDQIIEHVARGAREGDVVAIFSNGGFGGIHDLLLRRLKSES